MDVYLEVFSGCCAELVELMLRMQGVTAPLHQRDVNFRTAMDGGGSKQQRCFKTGWFAKF
ncbi:MAG: hypothetical protein P1P67_09915 [Treponema phagedenis]|uniref:Uncharacterized protein n=1 Tax=Treponema phagedenis TaxID=162 RepID=A0A0B7GRZ5_TREPH|nr:hypothetical protein [Treponema phagedenis]CEM61379.1 hypothetical protein TPHV1_180044 [Treponema phagedenis]